jgi:hypothetical protein
MHLGPPSEVRRSSLAVRPFECLDPDAERSIRVEIEDDGAFSGTCGRAESGVCSGSPEPHPPIPQFPRHIYRQAFDYLSPGPPMIPFYVRISSGNLGSCLTILAGHATLRL